MKQHPLRVNDAPCSAYPKRSLLRTADGGFSLVEVVIAMLLLAVLSIALLPLIISATIASSQNRSYLQATDYARGIVTEAQSFAPSVPGNLSSCSAVRQQVLLLGGVTQPDPASGFIARPAVSPCPTDFPGTLTLTVTIFDATNTQQFAELSTILRVGAV